jgi:hypothetical protein
MDIPSSVTIHIQTCPDQQSTSDASRWPVMFVMLLYIPLNNPPVDQVWCVNLELITNQLYGISIYTYKFHEKNVLFWLAKKHDVS